MPFTTFPSEGPYSPAQLTSDLNTNFNDAQTQLNALDGRLDTAEAELVSLDSRVDTLELGIPIQDEGVTVVSDPTAINFIGAGVSVSNVSGVATVNIAGSSGGGTNQNRVVNGCMRVDQRNAGAAQTITAGAALAYTLDRWYAFSTGANVTVQQIATNNDNRLRFTGAASNTGVGLGQRIESSNSYDLAGSSATLQVKLSSSSLTSVGWAVYYANTTNTFGTLASPTRTLIASGTFTITSTEAVYSTVLSSIPSAANTGLEIVFTGGALLGSQTLTIGDVKLEKGSTLTVFECRPLQQEVAFCQRHLNTYRLNGGKVAMSRNINTTTADGLVTFSVPLFGTPSFSARGVAADYAVAHAATATVCSALPTQQTGAPWGSMVRFTVASGLTANQPSDLFLNGADAALLFEAEIP